MPSMWLVMGFDSAIRDERKYLCVEYAGFAFHIRPSMDEYANTIAVFVQSNQERAQAKLAINRFMSAMAWKDGEPYMVLGGVGFGAPLSAKDRKPPLKNYSAKRRLGGGYISRFDFELLQNPTEPNQKLALALFRDALNSNNEFYRFLSFFKILNIQLRKGPEQTAWINANVSKLLNGPAKERIQTISKSESDIGKYLYKQGRNAIAHAYSRPIHDPDDPDAIESVILDMPVIRALARLFVEQELGVPSLNTIFDQHLYELAGFKEMFGSIAQELGQGESIPLHKFPLVPNLTLRLRDRKDIPLFHDLPFRVYASENGTVFLGTDIQRQPLYLLLSLDFPAERLDLELNNFGFISPSDQASEVMFFEFLIEYFRSGILEIYVGDQRIAFKEAFIPVNIDMVRTVDNWKRRMSDLGGWPLRSWDFTQKRFQSRN